MLKLAHPTIYHRGARSGDNQPGRCAMSTSAWRTKPIDARKSAFARIAEQHDPGEQHEADGERRVEMSARHRRQRDREADRNAGRLRRAAWRPTARARSSPIEPLGLRGIDATRRASASAPNADADSATAVSRTRAVSVTVSHYTWPRMRAVDLIRQKRDGGALSGRRRSARSSRASTDGSWPDYQVVRAADGDRLARHDARRGRRR